MATPMIFQRTLSTLLAALALAPAAVHASELDPHVELEVGFNTRSPEGATLTTWAPNIRAFAKVDDDLALSLAWGMAILDIEDAEGSGLSPLNPFIAVHLTPEMGRLRMRFGFGAALPLAEARDDATLEAYRTTRAIRGSWDSWLYTPDTFSLAVPVRLELEVAEPLLLAADGAAFLSVGTRAGSGEMVGLQGAVEARARLGELHLGLRGLVVRTDDATQPSLEPFAQLALGPVDLSARLTMNLAAPDGFAFDPDGIWGARVAVGYRF